MRRRKNWAWFALPCLLLGIAVFLDLGCVNILVHAWFTGNPRTGCPNLPVDFVGYASVDPPLQLSLKFRGEPDVDLTFEEGPRPPLTVVQWLWDFGDGTTGTGRVVSHTYADIGCYTVTLTVLFSNGMIATHTEPDYICVLRCDLPNLPPTAQAGVAGFVGGAGPHNVCVWEQVQLDGSGSSDPEGDPLTYAWTLASRPAGSNSLLVDANTVNPTFVPDVAGQYELQLVVDDGQPVKAPSSASTTLVQANQPTFNMFLHDPFNTGWRMGPNDTEIGTGLNYPNEMPPWWPWIFDMYDVSEFEVCNCLFTWVLNYADGQGYVEDLDPSKAPYTGGDVYHNNERLLQIEGGAAASEYCDIEYDVAGVYHSDGSHFYIARRDDQSMARHPVVEVSWYGCLAFCNWLSEMNSLPVMYDLTTWTRIPRATGGYRLPTEPEWEFAAAWDVAQIRHWVYGFSSDAIDATRANYASNNPLGLASTPLTSTVGYYDGVNAGTANSESPAGCHDMSGNVWEWVEDEPYVYLGGGPVPNPQAPDGTFVAGERIVRGGSWFESDPPNERDQRTARRNSDDPDTCDDTIGFRFVIYAGSPYYYYGW